MLSADEDRGSARFVRGVVAAGEAWGLKCARGWAVSESQAFADRSVMPFWSDRADATRAVYGEWAEYEPTRISLADFLAHWLPGMAEDELLVGTAWDAYDRGLEVLPLALREQFGTALAPQPAAVT